MTHRNNRYYTTTIGVAATAALILTPTSLGFGAICFMVANVANNAGYVFFNGFLPLMAKADQTYLEDPTEEVLGRVTSHLSATGMAWGWLSAFIVAVLGAVVQAILTKTSAASENTSNAVLCFMAAVWWGGFGFYALKRMKPRPV